MTAPDSRTRRPRGGDTVIDLRQAAASRQPGPGADAPGPQRPRPGRRRPGLPRRGRPRRGGTALLPALREVGRHAGSLEQRRLVEDSDASPARLETHDGTGARVDRVRTHPAWQQLLRDGAEAGLGGRPVGEHRAARPPGPRRRPAALGPDRAVVRRRAQHAPRGGGRGRRHARGRHLAAPPGLPPRRRGRAPRRGRPRPRRAARRGGGHRARQLGPGRPARDHGHPGARRPGGGRAHVAPQRAQVVRGQRRRRRPARHRGHRGRQRHLPRPAPGRPRPARRAAPAGQRPARLAGRRRGAAGGLGRPPGRRRRGRAPPAGCAPWTARAAVDGAVLAAAALRAAVLLGGTHARHRHVPGGPLDTVPLVRTLLADLAVESEAATLLALRLRGGGRTRPRRRSCAWPPRWPRPG